MTNSTRMTVKKTPAAWILTSPRGQNWRMVLRRAPELDAVLRQGKPVTYTMTTREVTTHLQTMNGMHVSSRTEVVGRHIETADGPIVITTDMVVI